MCVRVCPCVCVGVGVGACVCVCVCVCIRSSLHSVRFGQLLRCAHKRIVNIMKVYIERNIMQVELIRFLKNISPLFTFTFARRGIKRDPRVYAWKVVTIEACSIVIQFDNNVLLFTPFLTV